MHRSPGERQTCKACGHVNGFDFHVNDETWARVVPAHLRNRVVCLCCFDLFAYERGVSYAHEITTLYFAGEKSVLILEPLKAIDVTQDLTPAPPWH